MLGRFSFLFCLLSLFTHALHAQSKASGLLASIETQFLIAGELNSSFDFMSGARIQYQWSSERKLKPDISFGFATDIGNVDAQALLLDISFGAKWPLLRRIYAHGSFGSQYLNERHQLVLRDGKRNWTQSGFGITAQAGMSWVLSKHLSISTDLKQINLNYTSLGLALTYSL